MPSVRFVSLAGALLVQAHAEPGDNLLDVARVHDVPLHWRCGQGTCGTCRVQVDTVPPLLPPAQKECNVLGRAGLQAADWRLACHLLLRTEDWIVRVPPPTD